MKPSLHFKFCPQCAAPAPQIDPDKSCVCHRCGFVYYFNPAIAAAAFVLAPDGQALFIRRAKEPAKGKLALPGGFIDAGETAEGALRREIIEEVNLELASLEYLSSHPNQYFYKDVTYPVLDLFFVAKVRDTAATAALDGVESYSWLDPSRIDPSELAFPSMREAYAVFRRRFP